MLGKVIEPKMTNQWKKMVSPFLCIWIPWKSFCHQASCPKHGRQRPFLYYYDDLCFGSPPQQAHITCTCTRDDGKKWLEVAKDTKQTFANTLFLFATFMNSQRESKGPCFPSGCLVCLSIVLLKPQACIVCLLVHVRPYVCLAYIMIEQWVKSSNESK